MVKDYKGFLITLEGGEGSGKNSVINYIYKELKKRGVDVICTREPGGSKISEKIRNIILDPSHTEMCIRTELLLYEASRAQHTDEVLKPNLQKGKLILCSRYYDSSTVYQGFVRGLNIEDVKTLNSFASDKIVPDLTILLDVEAEVGLKRCQREDFSESYDRLELAGLDFHKKVNKAFLKLAEMEPRIRIVDTNQSLQQVYRDTMEKYILPFCKKHSLL